MKINGIFELIPGALYSARFDGQPCHEFSRVFRLWNDATYLEQFFESHYEDLVAFWEFMAVEEAVAITVDEANILEGAILDAARIGCKEGFDNLSVLFKPLSQVKFGIERLEKNKARGPRRHSWLRLYAVRLGVNKFVVSGGAIKLTRTMNERDHLLGELRKLEKVCEFLREDQNDEFGLFELF